MDTTQKVLLIGGSEESKSKVEKKMSDIFDDIKVIWARNYSDFLALNGVSASFLMVILGSSLEGYQSDLNDPAFLSSFSTVPIINLEELN